MVGPECVMDPVSFMQREIRQLIDTNVEYMDRLYNGRDGPGGARTRLERDMTTYFGALAEMSVSESDLLQKAIENSKIQDHVLNFIKAKDKAGYVLDLFDEWVVNNPRFPPRADVSFKLRQCIA